MAKADLRKAEIADLRAELGRALERAYKGLGWDLNQVTARLPLEDGKPRCPRQVARWVSGAERLQLDVLFACPELRVPLVVQWARLVARVTVRTLIDIEEVA